MSTLTLSVADAKAWLEHETESVFVPVHTKAQRMLDEVHKALDNLSESSKMLLDNSSKEIEKRNTKTYGRARALNKLARLFVERIGRIKFPENVTYESLKVFTQELQKAMAVTEVDLRKWFPRISPFFILDRRKFSGVFEKTKESLKDLETFISKEYVKTKTLEDTYQLLDTILALENQLSALAERRTDIQKERSTVERKIGETHDKIAKLRNCEELQLLIQIRKQISTLRPELKHNLRHLQKPFKKLQALATRGSGSGLAPEESQKLGQYLEKPFEAFSTEPIGYPLLRQILQKLRRSLSEEKLKLKSDKARKAEQDIDAILNNDSLADLHYRCRTAANQRSQLAASEQVVSTQKQIKELHEHIASLNRNKEAIETEEQSINRDHEETTEKIRRHKRETEKNILDFLEKKITIT